jgi:hypothetical protein
MRLFPGDWPGFLDDLAAWGGLSIAARRSFLDGITPGLSIDAGRGEGALSELRDEGMLEPSGRAGALAVSERFVPFHQVLKSLQKYPLFESPGLAVLCAYLGEHYTPQERSQLHESLALLPNDLTRMAGLVSSVEWVQTGLGRAPVAALTAPPPLAAARTMLEFFTEQRDRIPLRDVEEYFPSLPRDELLAGLRHGLLRAVFFLGLRRIDLEPLVGIWPAAARRLRRLTVVLAPEPAAAARTFLHPFLVEDMTSLLRGAFLEPIGLRRGDDRPFARFVEESALMLLTLPDWIEGATGLTPDGRVGLALQALRLTGLLQATGQGAAARLSPGAPARTWVKRPLAERLAAARDALEGAPLFALLDEETVPADGARNAIAPWVVQAFSSVPQSSFIRFTDFAEHQAALGSPLVVTAALTGGSRSQDAPGFATEEAVEELWRSFLGIFLGRCLLSLAGAEAGASPDGRLVFRMTGDGRFLLGLPHEGRESPPPEEQAAVLIVSPNYEVVFLAPSPGLEAELGRFCERVGREIGVLFRITRQSLERAAATGLTAGDVQGALARGSKSPLPSNVAHEIQSWMGENREP